MCVRRLEGLRAHTLVDGSSAAQRAHGDVLGGTAWISVLANRRRLPQPADTPRRVPLFTDLLFPAGASLDAAEYGRRVVVRRDVLRQRNIRALVGRLGAATQVNSEDTQCEIRGRHLISGGRIHEMS